ncbi:hypothetical protein HMPREF9123_0180 [Neisseria bacilliformis ATCC BAA-1200]|uniref:Uncharacterized protein n=1 Tax=Neisseria bacilliformis ATCC BAA-1200 TaxID=888742 RepID=F2B8T0_9NEIS|nr:hypothetical protein HMPREF9123_0180 [Neisseria bacilliformis ATCC BAA-1200]
MFGHLYFPLGIDGIFFARIPPAHQSERPSENLHAGFSDGLLSCRVLGCVDNQHFGGFSVIKRHLPR